MKSSIDNPDWRPLRTFACPEDITDIVPGPFEVHCDQLDFACDFIPYPEADRIVVVLHPGKTPSYPFFLHLPLRAGCHFLRIADPSVVFTDLKISCYLGREFSDPIAGILRIVDSVRACLDVRADRILYYGVSGGGFAALMCATHDGEAIGIGLNAQVELLEFADDSIGKVIANVFRPHSTLRQVAGEYPERFSVAAALRNAHQEGKSPRLLLSQNRGDETHFKNHFVPLCKTFSIPISGGIDISGDLMSICFNGPNGHAGWGTGKELDEAIERFVPGAPPVLLQHGVAQSKALSRGPIADLRVKAAENELSWTDFVEGKHRFLMPGDVEEVQVISHTFCPRDDDNFSTDDRKLGVAVRDLRFGFAKGEIKHANLGGGLLLDGWHELEQLDGRYWRWTNGDARLVIPRGVNVLDITVMNFEAEELGVTALVTGNQLKAARALAAVEQLDLAELSKVSIGTLRDMEAQEGEPIGGTAQNVRAVQKALEGRGIEFLNDGAPGVRLKKKRGIK